MHLDVDDENTNNNNKPTTTTNNIQRHADEDRNRHADAHAHSGLAAVGLPSDAQRKAAAACFRQACNRVCWRL